VRIRREEKAEGRSVGESVESVRRRVGMLFEKEEVGAPVQAGERGIGRGK